MGFLRLLRTRFALTLSLIALISAWTPVARAQDAAPPAHLAVVDGAATLERENRSEPATAGIPLVPGDRLRTAGGRVEVVFPEGSTLDLDEYTTLDVQSDTLLRLTAGRVLLTVVGASDPASARRYQVDTPLASARNEGPGEYRIALLNRPSGAEAELAVLRGYASLITEIGSTFVSAGQRSLARDHAAPGFPQAFNSARVDAFDLWTDARRDARLGTTASAQYLPRDLQVYGGSFDRYGSWQFEPSYGYVWFPSVAPGWRPYYNGYWTSVRPYGWTWIGLESWAWPTHHYGRWGNARDRWFWISDRQWAPAWVSWAAAPGYVSWCPLGFDNRPVFALSLASHSTWNGWVLVPRTHFGTPGRPVQHYAIASPSLPPRTPLIFQATAPIPPPRAVPRSAATAGINIPTLAATAVAPSSSLAAGARPNGVRNATVDARAIPRSSMAAAAARPTSDVSPPADTSPLFKVPMAESGVRASQQVRPYSARGTPAPSVWSQSVRPIGPAGAQQVPDGVGKPQGARPQGARPSERQSAPQPPAAAPAGVVPVPPVPSGRGRATQRSAAPTAVAAPPQAAASQGARRQAADAAPAPSGGGAPAPTASQPVSPPAGARSPHRSR